MADLDLSGVENWKPIGDYGGHYAETGQYDEAYIFTGTFDGNGFVIENLKINRPDAHYQDLFGKTGSGAELANIKLESVSVTGYNNTGGLVGSSAGTISTSYSTGTVTGAGNHTGGLVAYNGGTISTSYSTGTVTGSYYTGGLVGYNNNGKISYCYSASIVSEAGGSVGTLVGRMYNSSGKTSEVHNSYALSQSNLLLVGSRDYNSSSGSINNNIVSSDSDSLLDSRLKQLSSFLGWDFIDTWSIDENQSYPYLTNNEQIPHPGTN